MERLRRGEGKAKETIRTRFRPNATAVCLDDGAAYWQAHAHSSRTISREWLKDLLCVRARYPGSCVHDRASDSAERWFYQQRYAPLPPTSRGRVNGVTN